MSDFSDLVAKAIQPSMTREEREAVYTVVRKAVLRLQEREALRIFPEWWLRLRLYPLSECRLNLLTPLTDGIPRDGVGSMPLVTSWPSTSAR